MQKSAQHKRVKHGAKCSPRAPEKWGSWDCQNSKISKKNV